MKELSKNSFQQLAERYSGGGGIATIKIKDWYTKNYPTDDLGEEINGVNTFEDLWNEIHKMDINDVTDIYDVIGVIDSLVRERLFYNLSKIKGVEYRYIYDKWLESDVFYQGGGVGKPFIKEVTYEELKKAEMEDNGEKGWRDLEIDGEKVIKGGTSTTSQEYYEGGGKWQIKNSEDKYYSLNMQSGKPVWNESPSLGYSFAKDEAEIIKNKLGDNDLQVVKYDPNWWKMSDGSATLQEYAPGGKVTTRVEKKWRGDRDGKDIYYDTNAAWTENYGTMNDQGFAVTSGISKVFRKGTGEDEVKYYKKNKDFKIIREEKDKNGNTWLIDFLDISDDLKNTISFQLGDLYDEGGAIAIVGKRIKLIRMTDPYPVEPGTMGTITSIDGIGQIQVNWDNGRTLAVIPGEDEYEILEDAKHYEGGDIEAYENYIVELKKGSETRRLGILAHNQQDAVSKAKKMTGKGYSIVAIRFAEGGKLIQSARITELPTKPFDGMPMPKVFVTVDGKEEYLFEYYPDELTFSEKEFVGLTTDQARTLKFEKDKKFLQGDSYAGGGKPKKTKIYAVLRTSMGVLEDIEVSNTNVDEAMAKFQAIGINIPSGARITFQSQPYYYAEGGGLGESIHLYNNQPGHDKEYHMTIIKTGRNFTVVSKWGRRGSNLRETEKTVFNIEDAQKIFNKLKREKLAEGYIEKSGGESVPNPVPAPDPAPDPFVPVTDWGGDFVEMVNGEWVKIEKRTTPYKRSDKYSNKIYKVD